MKNIILLSVLIGMLTSLASGQVFQSEPITGFNALVTLTPVDNDEDSFSFEVPATLLPITLSVDPFNSIRVAGNPWEFKLEPTLLELPDSGGPVSFDLQQVTLGLNDRGGLYDLNHLAENYFESAGWHRQK